MPKSRHPLLRRLSWNPLLPGALFADLVYRTYAKGAGMMKLAGLGIIGVWLGMSVYNWFSSHHLLDMLYDVNFDDEGKREEAIAAYRAAITRRPDDADAHYNLGLALALSGPGNMDEAIGEFRAAIRLKPDDVEAHFNLGVALGTQGKLEEAIFAYRETIRHKPDYAEAHFNLGSALHDQGKLEEAIMAYRAAIRHKPDYAEAHDNLALALSEHANPPSAFAGLAPDSSEWHRRTADHWPDALVVEANNSGLRMTPADVANLPTMEDLFAFARLEAACPNPYACSVVVQYQDPTDGPRGGFRPRAEILEQIATGRSCISNERAQPGHHPVVVVTPGRNLLLYPSDKHQPSQAAQPLLSPRGSPWNIAVIAYTWGIARALAAVGYQPQKLQQFMTDRGKTTHDVVKDPVPFFDAVLDLAHSGHNVWVFEGDLGALAAGCRDADALIIDRAMINLLPEDWIKIAGQVMRGDVVGRVAGEPRVHATPVWVYDHETRTFDRVHNMTPGLPMESPSNTTTAPSVFP